MTNAIRTMVLTGLVVAGGLGVAPAFGGMTDGKSTGMLVGAGGHHAAGKVVIAKGTHGVFSVFILDARIDRAPDGRIHLAKDGDYRKGVELGGLTEFSGAFEFAIPAGVSHQDYNSVVIWCHKFDVEIGHAFFEKGVAK